MLRDVAYEEHSILKHIRADKIVTDNVRVRGTVELIKTEYDGYSKKKMVYVTDLSLCSWDNTPKCDLPDIKLRVSYSDNFKKNRVESGDHIAFTCRIQIEHPQQTCYDGLRPNHCNNITKLIVAYYEQYQNLKEDVNNEQ